MFCKYCGKEVNDDAKFCPHCGKNLADDPLEKVGNFVDEVTKQVDEKANKIIDDVGNAFNSNNQNQSSQGSIMTFLKTDRSFLVYLILSIVTCGIYNFFFIHNLAKDVNIACKNDSEHTPGVGMFIITWLIAILVSYFSSLGSVIISSTRDLTSAIQYGDLSNIFAIYSALLIPVVITSIISCIYPLYWRFKLGNKLQRNGNQYGIIINENGQTVILWDIIGMLCCCLGSWYAFYIIIKNTNAICTAYNNKYVLNR